MSLEEFLLVFISALLLLTNAFWAIVCHRLVNKIMSKNYAEYLQSSNTGAVKKRIDTNPDLDPVYVKEQERVATEANSMMGMI